MVIIMTFDKFLNHSIKVLLSFVMVVSITIITLFVTPIHVHAVSAESFGLEFNYVSWGSYSDFVWTIPTGGSSNQSIKFNVFSSGYYILDFSSYFNSDNISSNASVTVGYSGLSVGSGSSFTFNSSNPTGFIDVSSVNNSTASITFTFTNLILPNSISFADVFDITSSVASFHRSITIKPGYVAYVQTDGGTLDLVAQFHEYSRFSRPLWDNGVRISFNGGLVPTSGTVFNENFGSSVDWLKVASAPSNLLGQTMTGGRSFTAGLPEAGSNKCVIIYNPAYGNAGSLVGNGTIDLGVYISATFSNVIDVTQYKLRADATVTYTSGAAISSGSPDDYNLAYSYIPSENDPSDVVTDSDYRLLDLSNNTSGPAIDMNAGGYNGTSDYENDNPEEAENGILGLLTRIFKFLSAPVSHIMSLFNAGGNFMAWLGQLWVWLPSDVGAILVDALIVLIVIGAIKFLWK